MSLDKCSEGGEHDWEWVVYEGFSNYDLWIGGMIPDKAYFKAVDAGTANEDPGYWKCTKCGETKDDPTGDIVDKLLK